MKKNIKYIIFIIIAAIIIICGITCILVGNKIKTYKVDTLYEDLTPIEKIVSKVSGTKFYTKEEAIKDGIILSDEKKASKEVTEAFKPISDYLITSDSENIDSKIKDCEITLSSLQAFINSDRCNTDNLKNYAYACIETVVAYKSKLECYKSSDIAMYNHYSNKVVSKFKEVNISLDNIK
ncbi:hypothetical protein ACTM9W_12170 [Clostridium sp. HCP1S3_A12]|uniref:hypothetical protein n=1 Tax=unclassified Clostridium TaxID=2614128 RepID=UPI003F8C163B